MNGGFDPFTYATCTVFCSVSRDDSCSAILRYGGQRIPKGSQEHASSQDPPPVTYFWGRVYTMHYSLHHM
jgi:hypothetical protein